MPNPPNPLNQQTGMALAYWGYTPPSDPAQQTFQLPKGWEVMPTVSNLGPDWNVQRNASGAVENQFQVIRNRDTGEIAISFKGSDTASNWISDIGNAGASEFAKIEVKAQAALDAIRNDPAYAGYTIAAAGQSLAGGMAQSFAVRNGLDAYVYNSLPIARDTINNGYYDSVGGFDQAYQQWRSEHVVTDVRTPNDIATYYYTNVYRGVYLSDDPTILPGAAIPDALKFTLLSSTAIGSPTGPVALALMGQDHTMAALRDASTGLGVGSDGKFVVPSGALEFAAIPPFVRAEIGTLDASPIVNVTKNGDFWVITHSNGAKQWAGVDQNGDATIATLGETTGRTELSFNLNNVAAGTTVKQFDSNSSLISTEIRHSGPSNETDQSASNGGSGGTSTEIAPGTQTPATGTTTFTPVPYTLPDGTEGTAYAAPDRPALITTETGDRYTVGIDGQVTLLDPAPPGNPALEPVVFHSGGEASDTPATDTSTTTPNPLDALTPYVAGVNSALTLIQSIQQGNTLSAVLAGASLANTVNQLATGSTAPIVPGDLTAGLTALSTGLNLLDALDHHDTLGALTAGTNLASQAAGLWASSLSNQGAALIASGALSEGAALVAEAHSINALSNTLGEVAGAFNIVNSLAHHDPVGVISAVLMMNPATAPLGIAISIGRAILGGLLGGDEGEPAYVWVKASGDARFIRTDAGIEIHSSGTNEHKSTEGSAVGTATQGGQAAAGALGELLTHLQSQIDAHNAAHPDSPLALVPERLPQLHWRDPAWYAEWTDAASGEARSLAVGRATLAEDLLAVAQSGQAVVPQWQADSISQRLEHGQADAWRAAPVAQATGDTQSQDILVLGSGRMDQTVRSDVDGDGWSEAHTWSSRNVYLAIDRQGDGQITGRDDLLTLGKGGANSLGWLDANGDGKLDRSDPGFAALKVWLDANGDAVAQDHELAGLGDASIVAIDFGSYPPRIRYGTGETTALTEARLSGDMNNHHAFRIYCFRHIASERRKHYSVGIRFKTRRDAGLRTSRPGARRSPGEKQVALAECRESIRPSDGAWTTESVITI